jgi:protein-S-isoprenylcysteine O-methyltransferase Ste14
MAAVYLRLARREEADMTAEFGGEYRAYMLRTRRFIPRVW